MFVMAGTEKHYEERTLDVLIVGGGGAAALAALEVKRAGLTVGLDIIERPFIVLDDKTVLKPGMVVAIHPVLAPPPPVFEACADMFVVTEGKARKLSRVAPEIKVL